MTPFMDQSRSCTAPHVEQIAEQVRQLARLVDSQVTQCDVVGNLEGTVAVLKSALAEVADQECSEKQRYVVLRMQANAAKPAVVAAGVCVKAREEASTQHLLIVVVSTAEVANNT